ncbi:MAG: glycosyltransferase family 39 protein [Flavobacteriales bacterium]|nr:MAG: glycosyltransferase family 39 protein [Flavobacteriales bacterium]
MARADRYVLLALLLLNGVLKLCWLGVNELSGDEPFTVFWSQQKTSDLLAMFRDENNPPLYFFLIKWWSAATPYEVPWLRVPSAVFSALAVWPLFLLARKHASLWTAAGACLLLTFCNEHYTYAHEVRAYSLLTLLTISGMWQVDRMARNGPRAVLWLALVNTALVYTHFMGWAAIGIQFLCTLLVPEWRAGHKRWFKATAIALVLFLPYGWVFAQRVGTSVAQGTWLTAPAWDEPYSMLWRWSNAPVITVVFIAVVVFGLWKSNMKGTLERLALLWCGVPLAGLFLLSFVVPLYLDRYLVWAAPGFALLVATSLGALAGNRKLVRGSLAVACVGMLLTFTPWKDNGLKPSAVVKQVNEWASAPEALLAFTPEWYVHTMVAGYGVTTFQSEGYLERTKAFSQRGVSSTKEFDPSAHARERDAFVVIVDAGNMLNTSQQDLSAELRSLFPTVDSVEATKKVWVYRFRK